MTLQSMTGFARSEGTSGRYRWAWEFRSVNGKGLDLRLRLPSGLEGWEVDVRKLAAEHFSRGNMQISLALTIAETQVEPVVNQEALSAVLALRDQLAGIIDPAPLTLDTLLSIRGIVDFREPEEDEEHRAARDADLRAGLLAALRDLKSMRETEGLSLRQVLLSQVDRIEQLTGLIETDPSRSPAAIAAKLRLQVAQLVDDAASLDRDRLHAEVALLAT